MLFFFVFILPSVYATVSLDGPDRDIYNVGDEIVLSGYILENRTTNGLFRLSFECDTQTSRLPSVALGVEGGDKKQFPSEFSVPRTIAPISLTGDCRIVADFIENDVVVDSAVSSSFRITKSLHGNFDIDADRLQVGDNLTITGTVFKQNGQNVAGSAELFFDGGGGRYLVNVISIVDGRLRYTHSTKAGLPGTYSIDISVIDTGGNQQLFEQIATFDLVDDIVVGARVDRVTAFPSQELTISGSAETLLGEKIRDGAVRMEIGKAVHTTSLEDGVFSYTFNLPSTINSGRQTVIVRVTDLFGNRGSTTAEFFVEPKLSRLTATLSGKSFKPGDSVVVTPLLYDQADQLVEDDLSIEILDHRSKKLFVDVAKTNEDVSYTIPKFADPGIYTVKVSIPDISSKETFVVGGVSSVSIWLDNETAYIQNTGNVELRKPIKISLNDDQYVAVRKVAVVPEEVISVPLYDVGPPGEYDVVITVGDTVERFKNVKVVSVPSQHAVGIFLFFLALLVAFLIYFFGMKKYKFKTPSSHKKPHLPRPDKVAHIYHKPSTGDSKKPPRRPFRFSFGNREDEVKDFKRRVLEEINKTEERERRKKGSAGDGGIFGL